MKIYPIHPVIQVLGKFSQVKLLFITFIYEMNSFSAATTPGWHSVV